MKKNEKILSLAGEYCREGYPPDVSYKKAETFFAAWSSFTRQLRRKAERISKHEFAVDIDELCRDGL